MYQLGVEHHGNGVQNCRAIEILTAITGNTDTPGGQRGSTKLDMNYMGNFGLAPYDPNADRSCDGSKRLGADTHPLLNWWGMWANSNSIAEAGAT